MSHRGKKKAGSKANGTNKGGSMIESNYNFFVVLIVGPLFVGSSRRLNKCY